MSTADAPDRGLRVRLAAVAVLVVAANAASVAVAPFHLARSVATALDRTVYRIGVALYALVMVGTVLVTGGLVVALALRVTLGLYDRGVAALPLVGPGPLVSGAPAVSSRGSQVWIRSFADTVSLIGAYPLL